MTLHILLSKAAGRVTGRALRKLGVYEDIMALGRDIEQIITGLFRWAAILAVLAFLIAAFYGGREVADEAGWISHERTTMITARGDWLVGESKNCAAIRLTPEAAKVFNAEPNSVTQRINCDDGPEHTISITFWGRIVRPDQRAIIGVDWRCVKKSDSFSCYAVD